MMACSSASGVVFSATAKNQMSTTSSTARKICSHGCLDRNACLSGACRLTSTSENAAKAQNRIIASWNEEYSCTRSLVTASCTPKMRTAARLSPIPSATLSARRRGAVEGVEVTADTRHGGAPTGCATRKDFPGRRHANPLAPDI